MDTIEASAVQAFGPAARAYASRLPRQVKGIVCDATDSARALAAAVALRREGEPFFVAPLLDDNRALVAMACGHALLTQNSGDALRHLFDALAHEQLQLNDQPQGSIRLIDSNVMETMNDAVFAGDVLLARSQTELARLRAQLREHRPWTVAAPGIDASVPRVTHRGFGGPIVVWAPQYHASQLGVIAFALENFLTESIILCAGGMLPNVRARFLPPDAGIVASASVIIDASISDPSAAIALALCGAPLVCATTSGAHEYLGGVNLYEPWNWRSLMAAIASGRGESAPQIAADPMPSERISQALEDAKPPSLEHEPFVTIIVPTYNRAAMLEQCLTSLHKQRYSNFEILVVNDAGESVEEVVAKFPRARLVNRERNGGPMHAANTGLEFARGEYIGFLSDDDVYFPDFLPRVVGAMIASGSFVGHSNSVIRFIKKNEDGSERTVGYRWLSYMYLDRFEVHWAGAVSFTGMLVHRSMFEKYGPFDAENAAADYEMTLRLSRTHDFVHVDHMTAEFAYAMDGSSFSHKAGFENIQRSYEAIFDRYPVPGSTIAENGRSTSLKWLAEKHGKNYWEPAIMLPDDAHGHR